MTVLGDVLRLAVVRAESHPRRAELGDERHERTEVPSRGRLADQKPHPRPQSLPALLGREGLVIRADSGRGVRLERIPEDSGRMSIDAIGALDRELRELARRTGDHAGEVHHLGQPDHALAAEQALEVAGRERPPRRLEAGGRHAGGCGEEDVERQVLAHVDEPVDAVRSEDVRDLVRVGDDGRRPERQHEPRELGRKQLRGLEMHVCVDESGDDVRAVRVECLGTLVLAEPGDHAVADGHVDLEPLPCEDREHSAAADDEIRRLIPARHGETAGEITRLGHQVCLPRSIIQV